MPVSQMDFPSITICTQGLDMEAAQKAFELDFKAWMETQKNSTRRKRQTIQLDMDTYLKQKYKKLLTSFSISNKF